MKRHTPLFSVLMVWFALVLGGCDNTPKTVYEPRYASVPAIESSTYVFGVHPLHNPQRLFEVYRPLIDYLNARLSHGKIVLEASRNYDEYDKKLFSGHFDFALPNPYQTVKSTEHGYRIFGKMGDDHNFRGIILVRRDAGIEKVADLRGKSVSYPAPTALAATMMPQRFLHDRGIDVNRDIQNLYVGSQESSIMNVYLKKSAAASTWPPPWIAFAKERPEIARELKVMWETSSLPNNGLVVKKEIDPKLVEEVAQLLFSLHQSPEGRTILRAMELSRFEKADDKKYEPVVKFLADFEKEVRPIRIEP